MQKMVFQQLLLSDIPYKGVSAELGCLNSNFHSPSISHVTWGKLFDLNSLIQVNISHGNNSNTSTLQGRSMTSERMVGPGSGLGYWE